MHAAIHRIEVPSDDRHLERKKKQVAIQSAGALPGVHFTISLLIGTSQAAVTRITARALTVAATMAILERPCRRKSDATRRSIMAIKVKGITLRNRASSFRCRSVHAASGSFWEG